MGLVFSPASTEEDIKEEMSKQSKGLTVSFLDIFRLSLLFSVPSSKTAKSRKEKTGVDEPISDFRV